MIPSHLPLSRSPSLSRRSVLALLGVVALALGGCDTALSIADARSRGTGAEVTVEGTVTVAPGTFASALGDEGFAIQDDTAGLYVKVAEKLSFGLGARVRVTGTLDEQNQLRILKAVPADVELKSGTGTVPPKDVSTGGVNESVEGQLIRVSGAITQAFQDDSPYGYKLYINDGSGEVQVFVHVSAGFDAAALKALAVGQRIQVVGLAAQYETTYEVAPRMPGDLVVQTTTP
ncbi:MULTISPECIES: DNA-binding protein [Corallococcus]|uniref:DNA-binding protein n=1 Tax=Corallococcus TaxID=83461 RepID=UPI00117E11EA|nr:MULTISPECIES: DNA-binding protein [Corallococcus]NBD09404.1 DNA-binding protein [Corallococcus silvisoli]TSC31363.1 DNA-binding protein [Corallococcus sp. Z5C101001]